MKAFLLKVMFKISVMKLPLSAAIALLGVVGLAPLSWAQEVPSEELSQPLQLEDTTAQVDSSNDRLNQLADQINGNVFGINERRIAPLPGATNVGLPENTVLIEADNRDLAIGVELQSD